MLKRLALVFVMVSFAAGTAGAQSFDEAVALYSDKNYKEALSVAKPLADSGDARAMAMLGTLYQNGQGVKKDLKAAVKWLTAAGEKEHPGAQFQLAIIYLDGVSGKPDLKAAESWMKRAADNGSVPAQHNM